MRFKFLFLALFLAAFSYSGKSCVNYYVDISTSTPGLLCNENSTISVTSGPHTSGNDYVEMKLQTFEAGGWSTVQTLTSKKASFYHSGPCYFIEETFTVSPSYSGNDIFRVQVDVYRQSGGGSYTIVGEHYTEDVRPWGYKPVVLESINTVDNEGSAVAWASACISSEFDLAVSGAAGPTYYADYYFRVYESNSAGAKLGLLNSTSSSGENLGDFSTPTGTPFFDWVASSVQPMFQSELSSLTTGGYLLFELEVDNPDCGLSYTETNLLEVRATPYISGFYFEWDDDNNPFNALAVVQPSQNFSNPVSIGGVSGELVSDISTSYFDEYTVTLERFIGSGVQSWIPIAEDNVNVSGSQFRLNPNSITLISGYANSDMPLFNPGEVYKVFLTVETDGCPSSTNWSYYSVDPNNVLNKMGQLNLAESTTEAKYHYINSEEATLNLMGFDADASSYIFEVYNLTGQKQLQSTSSVLNISALPKSAYLVVAKNEQGQVYQEKFVW